MGTPRYWQIFAALVGGVALALLSTGVFVGHETGFRQRGHGEMAYLHVCKYLYFSGIRHAVSPSVVYASQAEASAQFCLPFDIGHPVELGATGFYDDPFSAIIHSSD